MLPPVGGLGLEQRWVLGAMDRSMAGIQGMQQCIEGRSTRCTCGVYGHQRCWYGPLCDFFNAGRQRHLQQDHVKLLGWYAAMWHALVHGIRWRWSGSP